MNRPPLHRGLAASPAGADASAPPASAPPPSGLGKSPSPDPAEVFDYLAQVLRSNPALLLDLQAARTPDEAAETLARIAAGHGVPTNGRELRRHVTRLAARARPGPLSDESLDQVSGGIGSAQQEWNSTLVGLLTSDGRGPPTD